MTQAAKSLTKRTFRDRYYSSMNFEEYYLLFGPPTPIVKPLDDPTEDIPELCLESNHLGDELCSTYQIDCLCPEYEASNQEKPINANEDQSIGEKSDPSEKGFYNSTNHTQSPNKKRSLSPEKKENLIRARSKSDNSEYLIFTFLDRINKKEIFMIYLRGKKRIKLE